jgi:2'-5' RNA ligase
MLSESALVVLVPEAEALVKPFRDQYDPSAGAGVPAHITLLYPFKAPDDVDEVVLDDLRRCFKCFAPIRFSLSAIRRFPVEVLYLAPEPDAPFRQLTLAICDRYPETPPYAGKWPDIIPHLSVANLSDEQELDRIAEEFALAARRMLPISATATQVALMDTRSGRWQVRATLELGSVQDP